jgi:hypothetical protein
VRKLLSEKHAEIAQLLRDLLVAKNNEICASLNAQYGEIERRLSQVGTRR